jgi:hypothetical protein
MRQIVSRKTETGPFLSGISAGDRLQFTCRTVPLSTVAVVMVAAGFPEARPVLPAELNAVQPFGAFQKYNLGTTSLTGPP